MGTPDSVSTILQPLAILHEAAYEGCDHRNRERHPTAAQPMVLAAERLLDIRARGRRFVSLWCSSIMVIEYRTAMAGVLGS